jgi:site-specific DNA recombinase
LLVQKWDRFSRNLTQALVTIDDFREKLNIEINSIEQFVDYSGTDYIMLLAMYLSTPEVENTKISERTRAGTRQALKEGRYVNRQPIGYIKGKDEKGKTLMQPDPKKAHLIEALFRDFSTGIYSQQDLLKIYDNRGLKLSKSTFSRLIDNVLYIGKVIVPAYKDEPSTTIPSLHSAIVSEDVFYKAQYVKYGKNKVPRIYDKKNPNFPLTGFLICAECGQILYGSQSNNGSTKVIRRTYYYYQCNSRHKCARYKNETIHRALDTIFQNINPSKGAVALYTAILIDEYKKLHASRLNDLQAINDEINKIDQLRQELAIKYTIGKIPEDIYDRAMNFQDKEKARLHAAKADTGDYQKDLDIFISFGLLLLTNLGTIYKSCSIEVKQKLLGSIFSDKLIFQKNEFRTSQFNHAITLLSKYNGEFKSLGKKKGGTFKSSSRSVPGVGIEPTHRSTRV